MLIGAPAPDEQNPYPKVGAERSEAVCPQWPGWGFFYVIKASANPQMMGANIYSPYAVEVNNNNNNSDTADADDNDRVEYRK